MGKTATVDTMTIDELQAQGEALAAKRSEMRARVKELEARIAEPELDPGLSFEAAVAALSDIDAELRAARVMEQAASKQIDAIRTAIAAAQQRERDAQLAEIRPREEAAKRAIVAAHQAYVKAFEDAHAMGREVQRHGGATIMLELTTHDFLRALRAQARRLLNFAPELAAEAGVKETKPGR